MLSARENETLCRVGAGTPMGTMLRRYWLPALLSSDLPERDGPPKRVRLLGENLVLFRDSEGRVGALDEYCPHRGASLVLARNENCALTCIYHGWKIDVTGKILDTPNEPEESRFKERISHIAYRVEEFGGVIWVYLGPPELEPPPMRFDWTEMGPSHVALMPLRVSCNWVQVVEGLIDSSHSNVLHSTQIRPAENTAVAGGGSQYRPSGYEFADRPSNDTRPRIDVQDTDYGFRYAATRRPLKEPEKYKYVRTTLFIAPVYAIVPGVHGWGTMQIPVPIDDEHTMFYNVRYCYDKPVDEADERMRAGVRLGVDVSEDHHSARTAANNWLQDREAMREGRSFSGIYGIMNEDIAVQESMGPIYDRSREHIGTADRAIIHMRRVMLNSARRVAEGGLPLGLHGEPVPYHLLRAEDRVMPLEEPWQLVGAFAGEPTS